jgi:hypothetical protein
MVSEHEIFSVACPSLGGRVCYNTYNLVSMEMVEKLKLETTSHMSPYMVSWL